MEWVETTGSSTTEAKQAAAEILGVVASEVEVEVLQEASSTLFGLRKSPARLRARIRPTAPPPKIERHDRRGRGGARRPTRGAKRDRPSTDKNQSGNKQPGKKQSSKSNADGGSTASSKKGTKTDSAGEQKQRTKRTVGTEQRGSRPARGARQENPSNRGTTGSPGADRDDGVKRRRRKLAPMATPTVSTPVAEVPASSSETPAKSTSSTRAASVATDSRSEDGTKRRIRRIDLPKKEETNMSDETTIEEQGEIVATFLQGLVESFGLDATAAVTSTEDDFIDVKIDGSGLGVLIGPGGHTLASLGEVAKTALQRQLGGSSRSRIRVDIAGYRGMRREALESFTADTAAKVRDTGAKHAFEPMNATDRKIVHDAVGELDGVDSESDGDEPRRRVVVVPA